MRSKLLKFRLLEISDSRFAAKPRPAVKLFIKKSEEKRIMFKTEPTVLKSILAVDDVNIWSARRKLQPGDFVHSELPPEKLASLGSKSAYAIPVRFEGVFHFKSTCGKCAG